MPASKTSAVPAISSPSADLGDTLIRLADSLLMPDTRLEPGNGAAAETERQFLERANGREAAIDERMKLCIAADHARHSWYTSARAAGLHLRPILIELNRRVSAFLDDAKCQLHGAPGKRALCHRCAENWLGAMFLHDLHGNALRLHNELVADRDAWDAGAAATVTAGQRSNPSRGGRPRKESPADAAICAAWPIARAAGVQLKDFAKDRGCSLDRVRRILDRERQRQSRARRNRDGG